MKAIILKTFGVVLMLTAMQACYYDNEETLYPDSVACDTTNVTYAGTIAPIMAANCNSCHNSGLANGGVITESYDGLKIVADNGRLEGAVFHQSGYSPMPQNLPQLPDCELTKIKIWIDAGAINN
ncbi:MAG: hypothetical protein KDC05_10910 [Bacteroidales bacterium]|nr:hypothetical protein [Bacteroidales bacterium]